MGTPRISCFVKGSQSTLQSLLEHVEEHGLEETVRVTGSFCFERCEHGPTVQVGDTVLSHCSADCAIKTLKSQLNGTNGTNGNGKQG